MAQQKEYSIEWGGRTLTIGVNLLAQQANGSCTVKYGDTMVLCAATLGGIREGLDFFPLQVDFEERYYAAGKIKGSRYIKREGRPTDEAIISGRMIDRALRPMFDKRMRNEVAVVTTVLSHDLENDADILGLIGSSCALALSNIPWAGPIAAARIGRKEDQFVLNPTYQDLEKDSFEVIVSGLDQKTVMLEGGASEISEDLAYGAIEFAHNHFSPVLDLIKKVVAENGHEKLDLFTPKTETEKQEMEERQTLIDQALAFLKTRSVEVLFAEPLKTKTDRQQAVRRLKEELEAHLTEAGIGKDRRAIGLSAVDGFVESEITRMILDEEKRADGRGLYEVRELQAEVGLLPRVHGSGLFMRGSTQVLSAVTLGGPGMAQSIDTMEFKVDRRFFHHYNFPSYAVSETKGSRGPGRREIGHGGLAERALLGILPTAEVFPYTIRVVSEVLGSNGSSSMGSATASSLALMDAGVPIKAPVAGIAIGVASDEENDRWRVITDLQDLEDGKGGMDFKVAGTREGITAIQMDTKTKGLPLAVVKEAFDRAKTARLQILDVMEARIAEPRSEMSPYAPRIETIKIKPDQIRDIIGPGGKIIQEIIAQTGAEIDVEDDGTVYITTSDADGMARAKDWILRLTKEVAVGEVYTGKVTRLMEFGAFVEILPGKEGLVHVSELAPHHVEKVSDVVNVGDTVTVKVYEIDRMGRLNLSIRRVDSDGPFPGGGGGSDRRGPSRGGSDRRGPGGGGRGGDRPRAPFRGGSDRRGPSGSPRGDYPVRSDDRAERDDSGMNSRPSDNDPFAIRL